MNIKKTFARFKLKLKALGRSKNFVHGNTWTMSTSTNMISVESWGDNAPPSETPHVDKRIDSNPIDVVNELVQHQVPLLDLKNIDEKIKSINNRIKLLKKQNLNTADEDLALKYITARKIFRKNPKVLDSWPIVTEANIDDLLKKYKLRRVRLGNGMYESLCPNDALKAMEDYTKVWNDLWPSIEKPEIILIISESVYKEIQRKKDPILLAKSPLGNWWHLLGAWNKEVEYVSDILYIKN
jgi:hypothetical protein